MTAFLSRAPTLDANWRAVVLFGRNVASYKFALARTLLELAERPDDRVTLEELAAPFARHLCAHLRTVDRQTTSSSSRFLDACRAFNRNDLSQDALIGTTARLGFTNVLDAFHKVGGKPVPVCFFADERQGKRGGAGAIRLTDDLRRLASSVQGAALSDEAEARWRLVETAWQLELPPTGIEVQADAENDLLFFGASQRIRRIDLTRVRHALNGYQRGCCFYCRAETPLTATDVDHFFPWTLKARGLMPDADGVWNLVLACARCNRGERGKFDRVPALRLVERLRDRNNWLVDSQHPLRETIRSQTGDDAEKRRDFLQKRYQMARDALIHEWMPTDVVADD